MNELVGLIPAAGHASRLPNLSGSKEIIPVRALNPSASRENVRPVCCHLLDAFSHAGVARCVLVTRTAKSDIPACLLAEGLRFRRIGVLGWMFKVDALLPL